MSFIYKIVLIFVTTLPFLLNHISAQQCQDTLYQRWTDDFFFTATSAQGMVGDVVPVDISLVIEDLRPELAGITVVGCYNDKFAEIVGEPRYTELYDRLAYFSYYTSLDGERGPRREGGGKGFTFAANVDADVAEQLFAPGEPVPLMTLFFQLKGEPGDSFTLQFCDDEFISPPPTAGPGCLRNNLYYIPSNEGQLESLSTRHISGEVRILEGEPTHPDMPPLPPPAKVYDEPPSAENAAIEFELRPSEVDLEARRMAFDFSITSSHEWSGYSLALDYPARYIRFSRIEQLARPGAVRFDDGMGWLGVVAAGSSRRLGREGERVRVARLHFDLSAEAIAAGAGELAVEFRPTPFHINWLQIRHRGGIAGSVPVSANVEPREARRAAIKLPLRVAAPGDVNLDERVDLSDAVSLLSSLFRGNGPVECPGASDFNADGRVNITDAVSILDWLYRAGAPAKARGVLCR